MKIEMRPIAEVKPYEQNPRLNDDAVEAVAESITRFGFRQPIVVDGDGVIVCGHTRWKAAQRLGLEKVPVHVARDLTPEQIRAYRIADNKTAELAEWNMELLPIELAELQDAGIDWSLLGFDQDELAKLLDPGVQEGLTDPDSVPEPPDNPVTKPGDLWVLGDHRLMCGDSSSAEDVDRLLDGQPIHLVNTDPPYNVKVEPRSNNAIAAGITSFSRREDLQCERSKSERGKKDRERQARKSTASHHQGFDLARHPEKSKPTGKMRAKDRPLVNDFVSDEEFERLLLAWFGNMARALEPGRGFYIWGGYANCANYPPALKASGLYFSQAIIWDKQHPVLTRKDFMGAHEWCFYGWKEGAAHVFLGPNNASDLWHVKKINPNAMVHLTEKPVELAARAMQYSSRPGEHVLDLFGGSGSTLIAAEQTGRRAFLMEIDPAYCDVIVQRWEQFTGRKAERLPGPEPSDRHGQGDGRKATHHLSSKANTEPSGSTSGDDL
ncbi:MAG: ParB N-terminal domain-containing protein [Planctomycetota bacterium]|nr:MAG: ParB N-terminal domain-containing protein [Planctomycetota bacterium]